MKSVEPEVFCIASTRLHNVETTQWLNHIGVEDFLFPRGTDGEKLIMAAGKRCYMSFVPGLNPNITKVRDDMTAFIDNILASSHGSVLEHVSFTFAIEGVSRVFTAEMNRHRAGMAISEGSLRYVRFTDIPVWIPTSIEIEPEDSELIKANKAMTRSIFLRAFQQAEENYRDLLDLWDLDKLTWASEEKKKQAFKVKKQLTSMFRRIIPMGVATGGIWTGNIRALRHIFTMRCDPAAEEEILLVASLMLKEMQLQEPRLFGDFELTDGYWQPKYRKV